MTDEQKLPDSDLLKAVHAYASDFYGRATRNKGAIDFESLDETALLGFGILLEEMAGHVLGDTGDLAFVEGEEVEETDTGTNIGIGRPVAESDTDPVPPNAASVNLEEAVLENGGSRKKKRRKLRHDAGLVE